MEAVISATPVPPCPTLTFPASARPDPHADERVWIIAPPHPDRERLAAELGVPPLVAQVLLHRGIRTGDGGREFLAPDFRDLSPPETLPHAVEAARRLVHAARARRRIVIYGDYDVDGITATAILWHALRLAGADVDSYLPSRFEHGYGIRSEALEHIAAAGGQTVVSVDCGITAVQEARRARELGLELIITDHHAPGRELPPADVVVHPSACGESPNPYLSGAGVALKVAWAVARELSQAPRVLAHLREALVDATALATLGLIADAVPLTGENRVIAAFGLARLPRSLNPGLRALLEAVPSGARRMPADDDVAFTLAPRLNAAGRMGHAREAVELLTQADATRAREIAAALDGHNRTRRSLERALALEAEQLVVERGFHRDGCRAIVLAGAGWHVGVIGIVAARLVDRFQRPTVLIALDNGIGQGSGRSIPHFPLHEVLAGCSQHLLGHGGHAMAAGVRIRSDQVDAFTRAFQDQAAQRLTCADLRPRLHLDQEVHLHDLQPHVVAHLARMAPFGNGNPRPRLATGEVELTEPPQPVGSGGAHLRFAVRQGEVHRRAIAIRGGRRLAELSEQRRVRLAFEPVMNEWRGSRRVELRVIDWKAVL